MRFNHGIFILVATLGLTLSPLYAQEQVQPSDTAPKNWQVELELRPITDDASTDVVNLVPKQSIQMRAYVWYPATETWMVNYPDWDMPGASIEKATTGLRYLEREEHGLLQYGHTQNYLLTPVDIGTLQLSQDSLDVSAGQDGSMIVPLKPLRLNVSLPEGVYSIEQFLPAYALEVEQAFYLYTNSAGAQRLEISEVEQLTLKKGEMLERRITQQAKGIKGSSIPAVTVNTAHDNVQAESSYQDINGMFGLEGGKRVDAFFYSPGEGGTVELAPLDIEWWHLDRKQLLTTSVPGVSFDSEKVEVYEQAIALSWWEKLSGEALTWITKISIVLALLAIGLRLGKELIQRVALRIKHIVCRVKHSEQLMFAKLLLALLVGSKQHSHALFLHWQSRTKIKKMPAILTRYFFTRYHTASLQRTSNKVQAEACSASRWQVMIHCMRLRKEINSRTGLKVKYQLPDL